MAAGPPTPPQEDARMNDVWQSSPFFMEPLRPPSLQAKPSWKTLEAEMQHQAQHCHDKLQRDLSNLHAQVLNEVHAAVAQEMMRVTRSFNGLQAVQNQAAMDLERLREASARNLETTRQTQGDLQQVRLELQKNSAELSEVLAEAVKRMSDDAMVAVQKEAQLVRDAAEGQQQLKEDLASAHLTLQALEARAGAVEKRLAEQESGSTRVTELVQQANDAIPNLEAMCLDRLGELELQLQRLQQSHLQHQADSHQELEKLEDRLQQGLHGHLKDALDNLKEQQEQLKAKASEIGEQLAELPAAKAQLLELSQQDSTVASDLKGLAARLEATEGLVSNARSQELTFQEQLGGLEQSLEDRERHMTRELERLKSECGREFALAQSNWARVVDWHAQVGELKDGKLEISSPKFAAAGLEPLQLHLRLQAKDRIYCGAFLQAQQGQVVFKLHVGGKSASFTADFTATSEWGSQRLSVLDRLEPSLLVRLEILDVSVPLTKGYPLSLTASSKLVDPQQVASREASAVRSTMVKRIEWRVGRISEHIAAVRAAASAGGEEEGWQPIVSPPFAAGGFENLQLHLYPLGYRVKGEDSCGFFLVCPKGMYVKCKAFVGDMVRVFDHRYEEREPYGRGNFCRLLDKVENDDSILCGIELQEIRLEQASQVRGGPFGSIVDEVKLIAHPSTGGMELVRELRDHKEVRRKKPPSRVNQYAHLAPAVDERPGAPDRIPVPLPGTLGISKSSPQLPAVASPSKFELPISPKISKWR